MNNNPLVTYVGVDPRHLRQDSISLDVDLRVPVAPDLSAFGVEDAFSGISFTFVRTRLRLAGPLPHAIRIPVFADVLGDASRQWSVPLEVCLVADPRHVWADSWPVCTLDGVCDIVASWQQGPAERMPVLPSLAGPVAFNPNSALTLLSIDRGGLSVPAHPGRLGRGKLLLRCEGNPVRSAESAHKLRDCLLDDGGDLESLERLLSSEGPQVEWNDWARLLASEPAPSRTVLDRLLASISGIDATGVRAVEIPDSVLIAAASAAGEPMVAMAGVFGSHVLVGNPRVQAQWFSAIVRRAVAGGRCPDLIRPYFEPLARGEFSRILDHLDQHLPNQGVAAVSDSMAGDSGMLADFGDAVVMLEGLRKGTVIRFDRVNRWLAEYVRRNPPVELDTLVANIGLRQTTLAMSARIAFEWIRSAAELSRAKESSAADRLLAITALLLRGLMGGNEVGAEPLPPELSDQSDLFFRMVDLCGEIVHLPHASKCRILALLCVCRINEKNPRFRDSAYAASQQALRHCVTAHLVPELRVVASLAYGRLLLLALDCQRRLVELWTGDATERMFTHTVNLMSGDDLPEEVAQAPFMAEPDLLTSAIKQTMQWMAIPARDLPAGEALVSYVPGSYALTTERLCLVDTGGRVHRVPHGQVLSYQLRGSGINRQVAVFELRDAQNLVLEGLPTGRAPEPGIFQWAHARSGRFAGGEASDPSSARQSTANLLALGAGTTMPALLAPERSGSGPTMATLPMPATTGRDAPGSGGALVPVESFQCPKCSAPYSDGIAFCMRCGARLEREVPS